MSGTAIDDGSWVEPVRPAPSRATRAPTASSPDAVWRLMERAASW